MEYQEIQRRTAPFLRDVAINVLANLVAAAIIYVGGVIFGIFPRSGPAIATAVAVILSFAFFPLVIASGFMKGHGRLAAVSVTFILLGTSTLAAELSSEDFTRYPRWLLVFTGVTMVCAGAWGTWTALRLSRRESLRGNRINGLNWIEPR